MPICRALTGHGVPIAPRTYWARRSRPPSQRSLTDAALTEILAGIYEPGPDGRRPPECLYGSVKMWEYLNRQGIRMTVRDELAASLGPFFNKQVAVIAEQTTRWSINTGRETRTYEMLEIQPFETEPTP